MIRPANIEDSDVITRISFESKGYWGYPEEYFEVWKDELTISSGYIQDNSVFVYEDHGLVVGYYSMTELKEDLEVSGIKIDMGYWLEHMFVMPGCIGHGIGTDLFNHLKEQCRAKGIKGFRILADPHSKGFYESMGCVYLKEYSSTIAGRTTPLLVFGID